MDQQFRILKPRPGQNSIHICIQALGAHCKGHSGMRHCQGDHTRVPQAPPPTKSSLEPPLPRGASPGLGRWALDVGAGGSYFHASAQRPWPPIRQAAALNLQRREADSQPRTPATTGTRPPAQTSSPLPTDITFVSRPPLSATLTSPPGHRWHPISHSRHIPRS